MSEWLSNRENRKWIYGVCLAIVPILVLYGVIDEQAAPLWIALIGAIVAPSLALANLTPGPKGPADGVDIPADVPQVADLDVES